jgi:hypothetical protein
VGYPKYKTQGFWTWGKKLMIVLTLRIRSLASNKFFSWVAYQLVPCQFFCSLRKSVLCMIMSLAYMFELKGTASRGILVLYFYLEVTTMHAWLTSWTLCEPNCLTAYILPNPGKGSGSNLLVFAL